MGGSCESGPEVHYLYKNKEMITPTYMYIVREANLSDWNILHVYKGCFTIRVHFRWGTQCDQ